PVLLLSFSFWQRQFGGRTDVLGRSVEMNDRPHVIVGVLPALPVYPDDNDVYMPTSACPFRSSDAAEHNRRFRMSALFGRLPDGVAPAQAEAELRTISERLQKDHTEAYADASSYRAAMVPVREELTRTGRTRLFVLLGLAGFLLLIV